MKKIILSLGMLVFVVAVVVGGTGAFFSDTETSTGNTFTAGSIDLSLGSGFSSDSNNANGSGVVVKDTNNAGGVLFEFDDLKPGDKGTVSFELSVESNDAYVCALSTLGDTPENGVIDPEEPDNTTGVNGGELQNYLQFATFDDDNENGVFDAGEPLNVNQYGGGDGNGFTYTQIAGAGWVPVADTNYPNTWLVEGSLTAGEDYSAGFMYCFGDFDSNGDCSVPFGADYNDSQTDGLEGGIEFYSVQTRNNEGFDCTTLNNT